MNWFIDIVGVVGVGLLTFGFWLAWPPAGFIACGFLMLIYALKAEIKPSKSKGNEEE